MKILYINVIEQNAGWGAENFINDGFNALGHEIINLDFRKYRNQLTSKLSSIKDIDVLFLQRGDGFPLYLLNACNVPKFFWATELVSRNRDQDRLLKSNIFEHVFVHSNECKKRIIEKKWIPEEKLTVILNGFDPKIHKKLNSKKNIDLLFIGSTLERREQIFKEIRKKHKLEVYSAFGDEMVNLFNRSKIVLNIHAEEFLDTETRIFEALGCGAFIISEKLSSENPFIPGKHYIEVSNLKTMDEKIDYYLNHKPEREKIALEGYKEALKKHTYTMRAEQFINMFQNYNLQNDSTSFDITKLKLFAIYERVKQLIKK